MLLLEPRVQIMEQDLFMYSFSYILRTGDKIFQPTLRHFNGRFPPLIRSTVVYAIIIVLFSTIKVGGCYRHFRWSYGELTLRH